MEHHVRIADALEPAQAALDLRAVRLFTGRRRDARRPAIGVPIFLIGQLEQDFAALWIGFALGEQPVGVRRLDFAAPHRFDGREIARVARGWSERHAVF